MYAILSIPTGTSVDMTVFGTQVFVQEKLEFLVRNSASVQTRAVQIKDFIYSNIRS